MLFGGDRLVGGWLERTAGFHVQMRTAAAIASENAVQDPISFVIGFEQHATCAIAEDDTGGTVAVIYDAAHLIRADHDDFFVAAAFDIHGAAGEGINKT